MRRIHSRYGRWVIIAAILMLAGVNQLNCSKRAVPFVSDQDQISNYLSGSADAKQLFRTDNIIGTAPFQLPNSSASYRDSVLSRTRQVVVLIGSAEDYGYLGVLKEALATVVDNFNVRRFKTDSVGTTFVDASHAITRYGYFLKLGDDAQPYVGWSLYGFNGFQGGLDFDKTAKLTINQVLLGDTSVAVDNRLYTDSLKDLSLHAPYYVKLRDLIEIPKGQTIVIGLDASLSTVAVFPQLSALQDSSLYYKIMDDRTGGLWVDTVKTKSVTADRFEIEVIQYISKGTGAPALTPTTIPYRVKP